MLFVKIYVNDEKRFEEVILDVKIVFEFFWEFVLKRKVIFVKIIKDDVFEF